jgi:hypothetical protein
LGFPPRVILSSSTFNIWQRSIFVFPTLNAPAALWSFDQAHTTRDDN